MKHIHHLTTTSLLLAMAVALIVGESIAWYVTTLLHVRFPAIAVGALCIGLVGAAVSWLYDGTE